MDMTGLIPSSLRSAEASLGAGRHWVFGQSGFCKYNVKSWLRCTRCLHDREHVELRIADVPVSRHNVGELIRLSASQNRAYGCPP